MSKYLPAILLFILFSLTACGDSDDPSSNSTNGPTYSGETSQATIDANNAQTLAIAATDAANNGDNQEELGAVFENIFVNLQNQKSGITAQATVAGNCGGTASFPDSLGTQGTITGTISFNNYCINGGVDVGQVVISGQVSFMAQVENGQLISMAIEINHMAISHDGDTITVNSTIAFAQNTFEFTTSADLAGSEGQTIRIENLVISGDPVTGISISSGRVYHPDNGYVDISTTANLVFDSCDNGKPISGTVLLEGSGATTATITFDGCTGYNVCVNGGCNAYNW